MWHGKASVVPGGNRNRLERKKLIILKDPRKGVSACHTGPQRKLQVLVRWQKTGARGKSSLEPSLELLWVNLGKAEKIV